MTKFEYSEDADKDNHPPDQHSKEQGDGKSSSKTGHSGQGQGNSQQQSEGKGQQGKGENMSNPHKEGTRRHQIRKELNEGQTPLEVARNHFDDVSNQTEPWIYRENIGGSRQPKPMNKQYAALKYEVNAEAKDHARENGLEEPDSLPMRAFDSEDMKEHREQMKKNGKGKQGTQGEGSGQSTIPTPPMNKHDAFVAECRRIRKWLDDNAGENDVKRVDIVSLRPIQTYAQLIAAGVDEDIPNEALLHSMTIHWSKESKKEAKVPSYDFTKIGKKEKGFHPVIPYLEKLAQARVPIMLVGPSGSGKSHIAHQLAHKMFGKDKDRYAECPLTAGAMPSWLIGSETVTGYKTRPFLDIYENGGVFCFEEIDAADPNMLMVLNNALAAQRFFNPSNGQTYEKHPDFVPVATANTWGLGANRFYNAREAIDLATRDRFRMGRVYVEYDESIENYMIETAITQRENVEA